MQLPDLQYKIALTLIPNLGPLSIKKIVARLGNIKAIFYEKNSTLLKIKGIGAGFINSFNRDEVLLKAEKQLNFIHKNKIKTLFYLDKNYPTRLFECMDAPVMLYLKGNCHLNSPKALSIVGTRNATEYGRNSTENLIKELSQTHKNTLIISGLAYGIDITAHKAAIEYGLPTIAVLGHGLEKLYPSLHSKYVNDIIKNGALLTEIPTGSKILKSSFIQRNRIIAGLSDATIIMETGVKGGALSTAYMANSYHREVFALPGKLTDDKSQGCNHLIKKNAARLIESVKDIEYVLKWEASNDNNRILQKKMFMKLTPEEEKVYSLLKSHKQLHIDEICEKLGFSMTHIVVLLLKLEFEGIIKNLPGKNYCIL